MVFGACSSLSPSVPLATSDADYTHALAIRIAAHEQLALREQQVGHLVEAAAHWRVLTLMAPNRENYRVQLDVVSGQAQGLGTERKEAGKAAFRRGDLDGASRALLGALALLPEDAEIQQTLRDIEHQRMVAIQFERAARFRASYGGSVSGAGNAFASSVNVAGAGGGQKTAPAAVVRDTAVRTYELEQALELFKAGDLEGGMRGMRSYVVANPRDTQGRERLAGVVYQYGQALEAQGKRELACSVMEQAQSLRVAPLAAWDIHIQALRKQISNDYYEQAWRVFRTDVSQAVKLWESSLRYDPQNARSALKLEEAKRLQESLLKIDRLRK